MWRIIAIFSIIAEYSRIMAISTFDLFKIGIGPSSSHTVGPMIAAKLFVEHIESIGLLNTIGQLHVELFGSLGHTGRGHGSDKAIILGLLGEHPTTVDPSHVDGIMDEIIESQKLALLTTQWIPFDIKKDLVFNKTESLPHRYGPLCLFR